MRRIICHNVSKTNEQSFKKPVQEPLRKISSKPSTKISHSKSSDLWQCQPNKIDDGKSVIIRKGRIHRYKCNHGKRLKGKKFQICNCADKSTRSPKNCNGFSLSGTSPVCY